MVFVKHNSLKSDIFFNPIFIPGFSGSRFFRAQVLQGPGFSGSGSRVQGPGPGSRIRVRVQGPGPGSRVRVQGLGPGFRSSLPFLGCVDLLIKLDSLFNKNYTKRILISLFQFPPEFHSQFQWKSDLIFRSFFTLVKITRISFKIPLPQWFFKTQTFLTHFLVFRKILRTYLNTRWSLTTKSNQFTYLHL